MSGHGKLVCRSCSRIVAQCRCFDCEKPVEYVERCPACERKAIPFAWPVLCALALVAFLACAKPDELAGLRVASNTASDAIAAEEGRVQLGVREDAYTRMAACVQGDDAVRTACRKQAAADAYAAWSSRIAEINRAAVLQHAVAQAVQQAEACRAAGDTTCVAATVVAIERLLPQITTSPTIDLPDGGAR